MNVKKKNIIVCIAVIFIPLIIFGILVFNESTETIMSYAAETGSVRADNDIKHLKNIFVIYALATGFIAACLSILAFSFISESDKQPRQTEDGLDKSLDIYRKIIADSPVGISIYDESGQCVEANDSAAKIIGATKGQILAQNYYKIDSWKKSGLFDKARKAVEERSTMRHLLTVKSSFGKDISLDCYLVPFESKGLFLMMHDITDRMKSEEEIRNSHEILQVILDTMPLGVLITDRDNRIRRANKYILDFLGCRSDEELSAHKLSEKICRDFVCSIDNDKRYPADSGQKTNISEQVFPDSEGNQITLMETVSQIRLPGENEDVFLGTLVDISDRKRLEQELAEKRSNLEQAVAERTSDLRESLKKVEDAKLQMEEAGRSKSRFLSSMSHELRTPLNGILGFADLLDGRFFGPLNEKQIKYVHMIDESGKKLLTLINNLLDMAKIDAGAMGLELTGVSPGEFIDAAASLMMAQFKKKNINLEVSVDTDLSSITADYRKCRQIMFNLLSNALKFTPEDGHVRIHAVKDKNSHLRITVSDTGSGIESHEIDEIFSEFSQTARVREEKIGGVGIGLALTRRMVEMHGGEIGVRSESGKGSDFWFTLPIKKLSIKNGNMKTDGDQKDITPKGRCILVAEDNEVNQAMILDMLSIHDHDVVLAKNGKEAIDFTIARKPELIFMDMRMPVMGGLEAVKQLRKMPEFATEPPIIALTASTGSEAEEKHIEAGCTEHLGKPIQSKELFAALERHLK
ncbi:ATP-binding protein [Desulfobacterales bacterium HSG16]|nr:ATP-binding protein [Desulfobacterales bacterium HSG16]